MPGGGYPNPYSRPGTSEAAAEANKPKAGTQRALVLEYIFDRSEWGATDEEIQRGLNMSANTQRPRRKELELAGFIVDSGKTRKTISGREAIVWVPKPNEGQQELFV